MKINLNKIEEFKKQSEKISKQNILELIETIAVNEPNKNVHESNNKRIIFNILSRIPGGQKLLSEYIKKTHIIQSQLVIGYPMGNIINPTDIDMKMFKDNRSKHLIIENIIERIIAYRFGGIPICYYKDFNERVIRIASERIRVWKRYLKQYGFEYVSKLPLEEFGIKKETHLGTDEFKVKKYLKGKIFIDGGAYIGDTLPPLLDLNPKEIHAYEPAKSNFKMLKKYIQNIFKAKNVRAINRGLWRSKETLTLNREGGIDTKIEDYGNYNIDVTSIDIEYAESNTPIGLIKLDIEGPEIEVLKGGSKIISRDKPILVIAGYHKYEHIYKIPQYLAKYGYDIYARQLKIAIKNYEELTFIGIPREAKE